MLLVSLLWESCAEILIVHAGKGKDCRFGATVDKLMLMITMAHDLLICRVVRTKLVYNYVWEYLYSALI